jgi:hypothetical protein
LCGWRTDDWHRLINSLDALPRDMQQKWCSALAVRQCCHGAFVEENSATKRVRIRANYCQHRLCPVCAQAKGRLWRRRLQAALGAPMSRTPKFITLTMPHTNDPLLTQILTLRLAFRRMREAPFWKNNVLGGYAFLEITHNAERNEWHPHFHIVAWSRFLDFNDLSHEWASRLGVPMAWVWIRPVKDVQGTSKYVTKYLTKGADASVYENPAVLEQYILATDRVHFASAFGQRMHKVARVAEKYDADLREHEVTRALEMGHWSTVGFFDQLHRRACTGNSLALGLLLRVPAWHRWWDLTHPKGVPKDV